MFKIYESGGALVIDDAAAPTTRTIGSRDGAIGGPDGIRTRARHGTSVAAHTVRTAVGAQHWPISAAVSPALPPARTNNAWVVMYAASAIARQPALTDQLPITSRGGSSQWSDQSIAHR